MPEIPADLLDRLPLDALVDLRRQARHLDAAFDAAIARRLAHGPDHSAVGDVLDVETAAKRLGTSPDSLYRKHRHLRLGYIDPLDGRLKFTEQEIADYIRRQRRG
jgi:hypothetical protein